MLGETEAWGGWVFPSKTFVSRRTGERLKNRVPGFLRKDSRLNLSGLIYVSWASTGLHFGRSKAQNSFNCMDRPRMKATKVQDRLIYRKREGRKGNLLPFVSITLFSFFSALQWSSVNWLWICLPRASRWVPQRVVLGVLSLSISVKAAGYSCAGWSQHKGAWLRSD